jgi:hypothetical protein
MELASKQTARLLRPSTVRLHPGLPSAISTTQTALRRRNISTTPWRNAPESSLLSLASSSSSGSPPTYFSNRQTLPMNTVVRFVPQQTAWIVERMGKFHRILEPGLAILVPFLDRIAYVKSLKESAIEIPSQNAITADNVTLELDGVLYTRVFDAYKARYATTIVSCFESSCSRIVLTFEGYLATEWKTPNMLFLSLRRQPCDRRSAS